MLATLFFGRRRWRQAQLPALAQLSPPPAAQAWRRLRRHRPAMISLALLVLLALLCLIGPSLLAGGGPPRARGEIKKAARGARRVGYHVIGPAKID
ncbi:ABC transporter permease, partial [Serratia sp. IR-2025]